MVRLSAYVMNTDPLTVLCGLIGAWVELINISAWSVCALLYALKLEYFRLK